MSTPFSVKVAPPPPPIAPAMVKFHAILQPALASVLSIWGKGRPKTKSGILSVALSFSPQVFSSRSYLPAFFSVASQNAWL